MPGRDVAAVEAYNLEREPYYLPLGDEVEVFLAAYRALDRLRDPSRFRAHLLTIAARRVADFLRRKSRRGQFLPLIEEPLAPTPRGSRAHVEAIEQGNDVSDGTRVVLRGLERIAKPLRLSRLEIEDPLQ